MEGFDQGVGDFDGINGCTRGDFNEILYPEEKRGGRGWRSVSQDDFTHFVLGNGLVDIPFNKGEYTWTIERPRFITDFCWLMIGLM